MTRSAAARLVLSGAIVFHLAAVAAELAPTEEASLEYFPPLIRSVVRPVLPVTAFVSRGTAWYLDRLLLRQSWDLFGPDPVAWSQTVEVTAFYSPGDDGEASSAEADRAAARNTDVGAARVRRWIVQGPRERTLPHWLDHRADRVLYNLGSPGWDSYVPVFGEYLCRTLADHAGGRPSVLSFANLWEETRVAWRPRTTSGVERQELGDHRCSERALES